MQRHRVHKIHEPFNGRDAEGIDGHAVLGKLVTRLQGLAEYCSSRSASTLEGKQCGFR
jgi:hypothetical protein